MSTMFLDNTRSTKVLPGSRKNFKQRLVPASTISCSEKMLYQAYEQKKKDESETETRNKTPITNLSEANTKSAYESEQYQPSAAANLTTLIAQPPLVGSQTQLQQHQACLMSKTMSTCFSQTLSAIHNNFDLMSQAVKESERSVKENCVKENFLIRNNSSKNMKNIVAHLRQGSSPDIKFIKAAASSRDKINHVTRAVKTLTSPLKARKLNHNFIPEKLS